jgi:hypothetical protein
VLFIPDSGGGTKCVAQYPPAQDWTTSKKNVSLRAVPARVC